MFAGSRDMDIDMDIRAGVAVTASGSVGLCAMGLGEESAESRARVLHGSTRGLVSRGSTCGRLDVRSGVVRLDVRSGVARLDARSSMLQLTALEPFTGLQKRVCGGNPCTSISDSL